MPDCSRPSPPPLTAEQAARAASCVNLARKLAAEAYRRWSESHPGLTPEDVLSYCYAALLAAARRFNPTFVSVVSPTGVKFSTYAFKCIRFKLRSFLTAHRQQTTDRLAPLGEDGVPAWAIPDVRPSRDDEVDDRGEVASLLANLTTDERAVVTLRYGLADGVPLSRAATAKRLGHGIEWTRAREVEAVEKMKASRPTRGTTTPRCGPR